MSAPAAPQPSARYLIIPFAQSGSAEDGVEPLAPWPQPLKRTLPHLHALLRAARTRSWHRGSLASRTPPHEWALAWAEGHLAELPARLPDDAALPWAAWAAQAHHPQRLPHADAAAAWFMPAHTEVGMDHVSLHPPEHLQLDDATSQALMQALAPLAGEDGIALHWVSAHRWLAVGEVFAGLALAAPDRVCSPSGERSLAPWMADLPPVLQRLQTEAQMLFYAHPLHDARATQGLLPVNGLWIAGCGRASRPAPPAAAGASVTVEPRLREAFLRGDAAGWLAAWEAIDREVLPQWLAPAAQPRVVCLCGERHVLALHLPPGEAAPRAARWIRRIFGPWRLIDERVVL